MADSQPGSAPRAAARRPFWRRPGGIALSILALLILGIAIGEAAGWPFLAGPVQRQLEKTLERKVRLADESAAQPRGVKVRFLFSLRVDAPYIEIGAPPWSQEPHMLLARDAWLKMGYGDLWRAKEGGPLRIKELRAGEIDARVERLADGRASWQFGDQPKPQKDEEAMQTPKFDLLRVANGGLKYRDAVLGSDVDARFSLTDHSGPPAGTGSGEAPALRGDTAASGAAAESSAPTTVAGPAKAASASEFRFDATGHYRRQPLKIELASNGVLVVMDQNAGDIALPVRLSATLGKASLSFHGTATDVLKLTALKGRFDVQGPSLAAAGDPLGVTLPSTPPFKVTGLLSKQGDVYYAIVDDAKVGSSQLSGAFGYDASRPVPLLSGRLDSKNLVLDDLAPAVGAPPDGAASGAKSAVPTTSNINAPAPQAAAENARAAKKKVPVAAAAAASAPPKGDRVLPDRPFDLPSLRAMDANVLVDVARLDLGTKLLEPLRPLKAHLVLQGGVLTLDEIDARTAQGTLAGMVRLDGRQATHAIYDADLALRGVQLERWLSQGRDDAKSPPYIAGRMDGFVKVRGQGQSTAAILGSLQGDIRLRIRDGSISHLVVEGAGIDVAQALGVLVKGDESLPMHCMVADMGVTKGVLRPRVMVVDTRDSTLWIDGSLSLASEALDLRMQVSPKDFSPFALRTPVHVAGHFGDPKISIEAKPLVGRVGAAALLAFVHPLAAVIPFFDRGDSEDAKKGENSCQALAGRLTKASG